MAVGIMSASNLAPFLGLSLLGCFFLVFTQAEVFRPQASSTAFLRSKRANMFLVEEMLQGNLERECMEEICSYEEAREYFEDTAKTDTFWSTYYDGNQCEPNPCLHGANCTDRIGSFSCSCLAPYHGKLCELGGGHVVEPSPKILPECPIEGPAACHQLCTVSYHTYTCSCMPGFKLQSDERSCLPEVKFPCGRLPGTAPLCPHGNCPWQVTVVNNSGRELCKGVVLGPSSILTAASCLYTETNIRDILVIPDSGELILTVQAMHLHPRFQAGRHDYNLAFLKLSRPLKFSPSIIHLCLPAKDFCENVLMTPGRTGITAMSGDGRMQDTAYVTLNECRAQLKPSHPISNKMFCMKGNPQTRSENLALQGPAEKNPAGRFERNNTEVLAHVDLERCVPLLAGMPVATVDRGTIFLTGLLTSSPADCESGALVFTKLSRHLSWIQPQLEEVKNLEMIPQVNTYPETLG